MDASDVRLKRDIQELEGMLAVNYSHLVAPLIEAFKSIVARVLALEEIVFGEHDRAIASLKSEVAVLQQLKELKEKEVSELKACLRVMILQHQCVKIQIGN